MTRTSKRNVKSRARAPKRGKPAPEGSGKTSLYGTHAVEAALLNPQRVIHALFLTGNAHERLSPVLSERGLKPEIVTSRDLAKKLGADAVHQGALLETSPLPEMHLAEFLKTSARDGAHKGSIDPAAPAPRNLILILDQVTDPHNVGAIIRSAAAFGVKALVMTRRNSPPLSGTLAKSASGGLEHVPVIHVTNLVRALNAIGDAGFFSIGLDGTGEYLLEEETGRQPLALVMGAEGTGLRRLTREACDRICRLATCGPLKSLNVSNAAAVAMHAVQRT